MRDTTNDIDALLRLWSESARSDHRRYHRALTALLAERDALKQRVDQLEMYQRLGRGSASDSDRDLREQMSAMMSWMTHVTDMILVHGLQADHAKSELLKRIDRAIVAGVAARAGAMRKGEADGK